MASDKFKAFVIAVGQDIKSLQDAVKSKYQETAVTKKQLDEAIKAVKSEIVGEGVSEDLDTIKELADKIASLSGDTSGALISKLTELGQKIDEIAETDYLAEYQKAKGE